MIDWGLGSGAATATGVGTRGSDGDLTAGCERCRAAAKPVTSAGVDTGTGVGVASGCERGCSCCGCCACCGLNNVCDRGCKGACGCAATTRTAAASFAVDVSSTTSAKTQKHPAPTRAAR